jgi:polyribonucleotide nucleotidyltransferase
MVLNPSRSQLAKADMDFMIAATSKNLMMVEGQAQECNEEDLVKAMEMAHDAIRIQIQAQEELRAKVGVTVKGITPNPGRILSCNKRWPTLPRQNIPDRQISFCQTR